MVLPEYLHCIWTLPAGDVDFSSRWRAIKTRFSKALPQDEHLSMNRQKQSGNGAFGSMPFVMITIMQGTWITFIITPSNMVGSMR
ncbi:MAG: hypothetical protein AUJ56_12710 [Zetaproteobacteria bacterium CG1_02_49_23]|nr:MAG: hypothetical protein AUJ56_12710 [Zetaproteobacteria bacterium CG1_02_49_23]